MINVTPVLGIAGLYKTSTTLNINSVADNAVAVPFSKWKLQAIIFHDASTTLAVSAAVIGLYTAAAAGGTNLVTSVVTGLVAATDSISQTLAAATTYQTASTIYYRPTVAHGSAATIIATTYFYDLT